MDLDPLRAELATVDRELITLVARRQDLAARIGRIKQEEGRALRDYAQERDVIERARKFAEDAGVSTELAENLLLALIRASLTAQERNQVMAQGDGSGQRVLVIGGAGKMGRWFVRFLASQNFQVEVADPGGDVPGFAHVSDWRTTTLNHDLIVVAAPLRTADEILRTLAANPPKGTIFDIGSLKRPLQEGLMALAGAGASVTSIHPMFGPDTELLSGRHVIFVDLGVPAATERVRRLFQSTMAIQVDMDLRSHDRSIAYVLGLSHALNIAFSAALAESGQAAPELDQLSSTTFDEQIRVARRVARENPHLYFEIQSLNDFGPEVLQSLLGTVQRLHDSVRDGDEASFVGLMTKGREYLAARAP